MSELNQKLELYRDNHRNCPNYNDIKKVLNQLLVIGFNNENKPNELPEEFIVEMVHFSTTDFEALMSDIGFSIKARPKFGCFCDRLYTYVVTLIQTHKLKD